MNEYTKDWQNMFLREASPQGVRPAKTLHQVEFLQRHLPLPNFRRVLDVCSGLGRHAGALAGLGYQVVGIDKDPGLVEEAGKTYPQSSFRQLDMRDLGTLSGEFDAVICLWQSFGYFDEETNARVLGFMADRLRFGGRLVLDLYNRRYFRVKKAVRRDSSFTGDKLNYRTAQRYLSGRFRFDIAWASGAEDHFDWQLYGPDEMKALGEAAGLRELLTCADWKDEQVAGNRRRMFQIIFEKPEPEDFAPVDPGARNL